MYAKSRSTVKIEAIILPRPFSKKAKVISDVIFENIEVIFGNFT